MRGVFRTFSHLVVIGVVVVIIAAILMAMPGSRQWAMGQGGRVTGVLGPSEIATLVEGVVDNLDSDSIADIVNDPDTRELLVDLIIEVLPGLDAGSVADLVNRTLADPGLGDLIVGLLPELDEQAVATLVNRLIADPAVVDFVIELLPLLDTVSLGGLINELMADARTVDFVNGLIAELDGAALAILVNNLEGVGELVSGLMPVYEDGVLVSGLDPEVLADLLDEVIGDPDTVVWVRGLIAELDPVTLAGIVNNLDAEGLGGLITNLVANLDAKELANLINGIIAVDENGDPSGLVELIDGVVEGLDAGNLAILLNDVVAPGGIVNQELIDLIIGLVNNLDGGHLGRFLSQVLASESVIDLLNCVLTLSEMSGDGGALDILLDREYGIMRVLEQDLFPYLWLYIFVADLEILGISAELDVYEGLFGSILKAYLVGRPVSLYYGDTPPPTSSLMELE